MTLHTVDCVNERTRVKNPVPHAAARVFERLPHPALEPTGGGDPRVLGRSAASSQLRERTAGGPRFSFFDGPVTANKTLGVHTRGAAR